TVDASDLTVNGQTPSSVTVSPDDLTTTFHFTVSPVTTEGLQSMSIPAGAVKSSDDKLDSQAFNANFRYDPNPMFVDSTNPVAGAVINLSGTTEHLVLHFSEPFDPNSVDTSDLQVSLGDVTAATPSADNQSIDYTISNISSEGTESYTLPYG